MITESTALVLPRGLPLYFPAFRLTALYDDDHEARHQWESKKSSSCVSEASDAKAGHTNTSTLSNVDVQPANMRIKCSMDTEAHDKNKYQQWQQWLSGLLRKLSCG